MDAPQLKGYEWFNSEPIDKKDLIGKVVLYDFWTYSCINCLRTIPYLRDWWEKYKDKEFLIIGIHTPEFEFEEYVPVVRNQLARHGINWPIVLDNDYDNWNAFANKTWPAKYLADQNQKIVYEHFGEGSYRETEEMIRKLLKKDFENLPKISVGETRGICFPQTTELYLGYKQGKLSFPQKFHKDKIYDYSEIFKVHEDSVALLGKFLVKDKYAEAQSSVSSILLNFKGTEVNIVTENDEDEVPTLEILLDNKPMPKNIRGLDVNEKSQVEVGEPRMYNLIKSKTPVSGILNVRSIDATFRAYTFTFSGCPK